MRLSALVMVHRVMAYIVMAYIVMAHRVMVHIIMAVYRYAECGCLLVDMDSFGSRRASAIPGIAGSALHRHCRPHASRTGIGVPMGRRKALQQWHGPCPACVCARCVHVYATCLHALRRVTRQAYFCQIVIIVILPDCNNCNFARL